jgi:simple sugar transport system substrate-binding protein
MKASKLVSTRKGNRARLVALAIPATLAALVLAGCTPAGTTTSSSAAPSNGGSAKGSGNLNIVVIGGASDDAFFSTVKRGVDDAKRAVEANGGKVTYLALQNYNNLGPDVAQLIKNAAGQHPSAIAVPDWVPEAEDPAIKEVVASGVPVIIYNAGGLDAAKKVGALTYIGTDEYLAGVAGGEAAGQAGVTKAICVNSVPGAQNLEDRCKGFADGVAKSGGASTQLALPASNYGNQTAVAQAIKAALAQDPSVNGLATVGGSDIDAGLSALQQANAGGKIKYVHFNTDTKTLTAIQAGTILAGIDQQPYAQGYYSVSAAFQYVAWGINLPAKPILTGPLVINKDNVNQAIDGAKAGVR